MGSKHLSIHFFYVENESILIQTPNGKNILYDCGIESAAQEIHARLVILGVQKLDVMIASHAHQDHAAGFYKFDQITNRSITMGDLYDNGENAIDDDWFLNYRSFRDNLPDGGNYHKVIGKMKLSLDPDVEIFLYVDCNWPGNTEAYRKYRSVWMTIKYNDATVLVEGDSRSGYESIMLKDFATIGKAHLLKLSEHGSKDSTKEDLLDRVNPVFVAICNKHHEKLPNEEVLKRLGNRKKLNTKKEKSDIQVSTDGKIKNGKVSYKVTYMKPE